MKKIIQLAILTLFTLNMQAQCMKEVISTDTRYQNLGPAGTVGIHRLIYLITPAEMAASGIPSGTPMRAISFKISHSYGNNVKGFLNLKMKNTTDLTYNLGFNYPTAISGMTTVHNDSVTVGNTAGYYDIPFSGGSAFTYNGGGLYIAMDYTRCGSILYGGIAGKTSSNLIVEAGGPNCTGTLLTALAYLGARPSLRLSGPIKNNDFSIDYLYTPGHTSQANGTIKLHAIVSNYSATDMSRSINLSTSGANSSSLNINVGNLKPCVSKKVDIPFTPTADGLTNLTVSLNGFDGDGTNNSKSSSVRVDSSFSHQFHNEAPTAAFALNQNSTLVTRIQNSNSGLINHTLLGINPPAGMTFKISIYGSDANGNITFPAIYTDATNRTALGGNQSYAMPNVAVPAGDFFIAVENMSNSQLAVFYNPDSRIPANTFYLSNKNVVSIDSLVDLAGFDSILSFRPFVGVGMCDPLITPTLIYPSSVCGGSTFLCVADTTGIKGVQSFTWNLAPGMSGSSTTDSIFITASSSLSGTFPVTCTANYGCGSSAPVTNYPYFTPANADIWNSNFGTSSPGTDSVSMYQTEGIWNTYVPLNSNCKKMVGIYDNVGGNKLGRVKVKTTIPSSVQSYNGQPYCPRYFKIEPVADGPASIHLYFTQDDFNKYNVVASANGWPLLPTVGLQNHPNIANIRITKVSGSLASPTGPPTVITPIQFGVNWVASENAWTVSIQVSGFSEFYLHAVNPNNVPLPVNWQSFTATKKATTNFLEWTTASEINSSHFNVQYSTDGRDFTPIEKVASQAPNGHSSSFINYTYHHTEPQNGHNYYRIEQVDIDNNTSYSAIKDVIWNTNGSSYTIYPKPANEQLYIDANLKENAIIQLRLLNMNGAVVLNKEVRGQTGLQKLLMNLNETSNGVYVLEIIENKVRVSQEKIVIQH